MLTVTACSGGGGGGLADAMALVPAGGEVHLTDWSALKASREKEDDESEAEAAQKLMLDLSRSGLAPSVTYDVARFPDHKEHWGWDLTDLKWEAAFSREGAVAHVLGLGDSFDANELAAVLEERGYEAREVEGVSVYEHEMDPQAEWFAPSGVPTAPLTVFNIALLKDQNAIMVASEPAAIEAALTEPDAAADEDLAATLEALGEPAVAMVAAGGQEHCERVVAVPRGAPPAFEAELDEYRGSQYAAMGYGYAVDAEEPTARIVLRYEDESTAEADVDVRRSAGQQPSMRTRRPNEAFTLEDITVDGQNIVMEVSPGAEGQLRISEAYATGDLLVAAC